VTMAKRTHYRLDFVLEDARADRAIRRGFHIEWCACRRIARRDWAAVCHPN
jgi:hypothetical protein